MEIQISEEAVNWYKEEFDVESAAFRFFVRYGGVGDLIPGFSLGVNMESPNNPAVSTTVNGIRFFIEEADCWYFDNKNLNITLDEKQLEPQFAYD